MKGRYQVEFSDLHQLLSVQSDLLHVDGDGEHGVGATAREEEREALSKRLKASGVRAGRLLWASTWSRRSSAWTPSSSWLLLAPGSDKPRLCCGPSPPPDPSPPRCAADTTTNLSWTPSFHPDLVLSN